MLALLVAGIIHLHAQTTNEAAWDALVAATPEATSSTPEAAAIRTNILAGESMTERERRILTQITIAQGGHALNGLTYRTIAESAMTGPGAVRVRASVKYWDRDSTGWTQEMVASRPDFASQLAVIPGASAEFREMTWQAVASAPAHNPAIRRFFKEFRGTLSKAAQVEVTQRQKDMLLAIPTRDAVANSWLAEISGDLVALQLDQ